MWKYDNLTLYHDNSLENKSKRTEENKMKKKLLSLAMIGVLVLGAACLTGCGKDDAQQEADT